MTVDPRDILHRPAAPGTPLTYGPGPEQVGELFPAETTPRGAVALWHGGFWRHEYDRAHLRPFSRALAAAGWTVLLLEYRRVGGGGGWPHTFDDVRAGLVAAPRLLRDHAQPLQPLVLSGHSAGGQLALWAAASLTEPAVSGVVALAPVSDLRECHASGLGDDAAADFLGGGPADVPERYAAADPMGLPAPNGAVVVHGADDDRVPVSMSRRYARRTSATLHELSDMEHFGLVDPQSHAWPSVLAAFTLAAGDEAENRPGGLLRIVGVAGQGEVSRVAVEHDPRLDRRQITMLCGHQSAVHSAVI